MRVSVIIPVYNTKAYLEEAVSSVTCQGDVEVILVDDGSTDGSGALCDKLSSDTVKVIHQENKYVGEARNTGLNAATGDYVYFLDSDDTMNPVLPVLEGKTADVVSSTVRFVGGKKLSWEGEKDSAGLFLFSPYLGQNFYRRDWLQKKGVRFSAERKTAEDCEWLFSILENASIETVDTPFYSYREQRDGSLCTNYRKSAIAPTVETWKKLYDKVDKTSYPKKEELKAYMADGLIQHLIRAEMAGMDDLVSSAMPYLNQKGCKARPFLLLSKIFGRKAFFSFLNLKMRITPPTEG